MIYYSGLNRGISKRATTSPWFTNLLIVLALSTRCRLPPVSATTFFQSGHTNGNLFRRGEKMGVGQNGMIIRGGSFSEPEEEEYDDTTTSYYDDDTENGEIGLSPGEGAHYGQDKQAQQKPKTVDNHDEINLQGTDMAQSVGGDLESSIYMDEDEGSVTELGDTTNEREIVMEDEYSVDLIEEEGHDEVGRNDVSNALFEDEGNYSVGLDTGDVQSVGNMDDSETSFENDYDSATTKEETNNDDVMWFLDEQEKAPEQDNFGSQNEETTTIREEELEDMESLLQEIGSTNEEEQSEDNDGVISALDMSSSTNTEETTVAWEEKSADASLSGSIALEQYDTEDQFSDDHDSFIKDDTSNSSIYENETDESNTYSNISYNDEHEVVKNDEGSIFPLSENSRSPEFLSDDTKNTASSTSYQYMVTSQMKNILMKDLGYTSEEASGIKPEVAVVVIKKALQCPSSGMPSAWFTQDPTANKSIFSLGKQISLFRKQISSLCGKQISDERKKKIIQGLTVGVLSVVLVKQKKQPGKDSVGGPRMQKGGRRNSVPNRPKEIKHTAEKKVEEALNAANIAQESLQEYGTKEQPSPSSDERETTFESVSTENENTRKATEFGGADKELGETPLDVAITSVLKGIWNLFNIPY